jgi:hypothetical protein
MRLDDFVLAMVDIKDLRLEISTQTKGHMMVRLHHVDLFV